MSEGLKQCTKVLPHDNDSKDSAESVHANDNDFGTNDQNGEHFDKPTDSNDKCGARVAPNVIKSDLRVEDKPESACDSDDSKHDGESDQHIANKTSGSTEDAKSLKKVECLGRDQEKSLPTDTETTAPSYASPRADRTDSGSVDLTVKCSCAATASAADNDCAAAAVTSAAESLGDVSESATVAGLAPAACKERARQHQSVCCDGATVQQACKEQQHQLRLQQPRNQSLVSSFITRFMGEFSFL